MKKPTVKALCLALALVLALAFSGCQSGETSQSPGASQVDEQPDASQGDASTEKDPLDFSEPITMDLFNMSGSAAGEHPGWFGKFVKDGWNMTLNLIPNDGDGDAKFQTMSASGRLGDMIVFSNPGNNFQQAIKTGVLLLDLSKDDAFATYMPYFNEHFPKAVERMATFSESGLYGIPTRVSMMSPLETQNASEVEGALTLRYDSYLDAGAPLLTPLEDLIPCFEAMRQAHPTTESGKTTYAVSLHSESDGPAGMFHAEAIARLWGYRPIDTGAVLYVDNLAENTMHVLQEDGYYLRAIRFFYDLNQRGLLDPDSITQTSADVRAKFSEGQIFYSNFYWESKEAFNTPERTEANQGYELVVLQDQKSSSPGFYPGGDNGNILALGADCKDVPRALNFFDWAYTSDGVMTLYNGPEGLTWEYDDNGMPYLTEFGKEALPMNDVEVPEEWGGGTFSDGFQKLSLYPLSNAEIDPGFGEAYKYANWTSTLTNNMSNLDKLWSENMDGSRYTKEYLQDHDMLAVIPGNTYTIPAMETEMKATRDQVGNIIKQYSWQMIYASDDTEYEALKQEMIQMAEDLGYNTLLDYYNELLPKIHEARMEAVESAQ